MNFTNRIQVAVAAAVPMHTWDWNSYTSFFSSSMCNYIYRTHRHNSNYITELISPIISSAIRRKISVASILARNFFSTIFIILYVPYSQCIRVYGTRVRRTNSLIPSVCILLILQRVIVNWIFSLWRVFYFLFVYVPWNTRHFYVIFAPIYNSLYRGVRKKNSPIQDYSSLIVVFVSVLARYFVVE